MRMMPSFARSDEPAPRWARWTLFAAALALAALMASTVNATRFGLRCIDGQLVAYRGRMLPSGERPLDDPRVPPLSVPATACISVDVRDRRELEARYLEIAMQGTQLGEGTSDERLAPTSWAEELARTLRQRKPESTTHDEPGLSRQLQSEYEDTRAALERFRATIRTARQAGMDATVETYEERLRELLVEPGTLAPNEASSPFDANARAL